MKRIFNFYADPGHGWLSVKKQYLIELGIAEKITRFSYQRGDTAYLEEDCDLSLFLNAIKQHGDEADIRDHHTDRQSRIRNYDSYSNESVCFRAVATIRDPRTNAGMTGPVHKEMSSYSRTAAQHQAKCWSHEGYWSVVYDKVTQEAVFEFAPEKSLSDQR